MQFRDLFIEVPERGEGLRRLLNLVEEEKRPPWLDRLAVGQ